VLLLGSALVGRATASRGSGECTTPTEALPGLVVYLWKNAGFTALI
jgi:hypothetical protein